MGKGTDRTEILRRDCPTCRGNGYVTQGSTESPCEHCGGSGVLEKEVPFKFDGVRSKEEIADIWGVEPGQVRDAGHSEGV